MTVQEQEAISRRWLNEHLGLMLKVVRGCDLGRCAERFGTAPTRAGNIAGQLEMKIHFAETPARLIFARADYSRM
jgi:hypothetical protein